MKKYLLYGHGGAYNHGAEAIVRTTVPLLRERDPEAMILLSTHFPGQDAEFGLDKLVDRLIPADLSLIPEERSAAVFEEKECAAAEIYRDALAEIDQNTVCVGIGGDNYCYPNWHRQAVFHHAAKARGARSVLWGCSIEPDMIDERMTEVLRGHDHIYARESLTLAALHRHGIENVTLRPDPAFLLEPEPCPLPQGFCPGSTAAMNLSPLAMRRSDALLDAFADTARILLQHLGALMFIHHVTMPMDNDYDALYALYERLTPEERQRVCFASETLNAGQIKYLICQCEMLICCRTHASIAGYSCGIPTIVVGYSVKSRGLGLDLGMRNRVLPVEKCGSLSTVIYGLW